MQTLIVCVLLLVGVFSAKLEHDGDIFDKFDIEKILNDETKTTAAVNCLLGVSSCSKEYENIREHVPNILSTNCGDCTPAQKATYESGMKSFKKKYPELYNALFGKRR